MVMLAKVHINILKKHACQYEKEINRLHIHYLVHKFVIKLLMSCWVKPMYSLYPSLISINTCRVLTSLCKGINFFLHSDCITLLLFNIP